MSGCAFVWFCSRPTRVHEAQPSNPNAAAMLRQALHDMPFQRARAFWVAASPPGFTSEASNDSVES
jgi:hypothetical protein